MRQLTQSCAALSAAVIILTSTWAPAAEPLKQIGPEDLQSILEDEQGNIVILNLWATWCAPCLVEIPDLQEVEADLKDSNVSLIGLSVDEPSFSTDHIAKLRDKRFPSFRTYARAQGDADDLVSVIDPAWNEVVPTTYVLDRSGDVHARIQGKKSFEEFRAAVLAALD